MRHRPIFRCLTGLLLWLTCQHFAYAQGLSSKLSLGTGFFVSSDGYLVTSHHLIKGKAQVLVGPADQTGNRRFVVAQVKRTDAKRDLALLKIPLRGKALPVTPWHDVPVGLEVYAIGYPQIRLQGLSPKITQGIINGERDVGGEISYFQFSAEIQKGNSGGPIVASDGSVIGIVRGKLNAFSVVKKTRDWPQNVNYGVKSSALLDFLKECGMSIPRHSLDLNAQLRPYQIYQQTAGSVLVVIGRHQTTTPLRDIQIVPH